ncbi:probable CCR4-associated factor 1 homolog 9 [Oryza brachyantha]|uniref:probable CCR4-associated factor 1 homolog 9 n=1 Tax=Oryza brachyantha TaxID=4533 RepID=UPI001AD9ACC5|nr:probable CCR4-associated factor 1 homolog 9 [Oryza brachyantha]
MAAVRAVWAENFAVESALFHAVAPLAAYAAINVQYPGCVVTAPRYYDLTTAEQRYQVVRANADQLEPLQLGIAIRTSDGRTFAWEFNLNGFDLAAAANNTCNPSSIAYLRRRGIDFNALPWSGVSTASLRSLLLSSGLLLARPFWATFAGAYHVAYFAKLLLGTNLPDDLATFEETVGGLGALLGPNVYDVRLQIT